MFNYTSYGNIKINSCSTVSKKENFLSKYQKGDKAWLYYKAKRGILESVVIKELRIIGGAFSYNQVVSIYIDTYNFYYNEQELIKENEAKDLVREFVINKINELSKSKNPCTLNKNSVGNCKNQPLS